MKLLLLIIFLCGITSTPHYVAKAKKTGVSQAKTTIANKPSSANLDMLPSGLLFQY